MMKKGLLILLMSLLYGRGIVASRLPEKPLHKKAFPKINQDGSKSNGEREGWTLLAPNEPGASPHLIVTPNDRLEQLVEKYEKLTQDVVRINKKYEKIEKENKDLKAENLGLKRENRRLVRESVIAQMNQRLVQENERLQDQSNPSLRTIVTSYVQKYGKETIAMFALLALFSKIRSRG